MGSPGATEVYSTIFIQFKCFGKLMLEKYPSPSLWRVIPSAQGPAGENGICNSSMDETQDKHQDMVMELSTNEVRCQPT